MARSYKFAIVRFSPNEVRGERINIAALIFADKGIDLRVTRRIDRVKAISNAVENESLLQLLENLKLLDKESLSAGLNDTSARLEQLQRLGPFSFSKLGSFVAASENAYATQVDNLLRLLVEPEPAQQKIRIKKTRLFSEVKGIFRRERVLAQGDEGLESHRIVPTYQLDDGLVADLVLRNSYYHVIETVDASGDEHAFRKAITEIAISALVLERARMRFGDSETKAKLLYSASAILEKAAQPSLDAAQHQGAELVNWASANDRARFIKDLSSLATPIEQKRKKRFVSPGGGGLFH
jgi:hypothetical protein